MTTQTQPQSGLPCPQCQLVIPVTITTLLAGHAVHCPRCALKLEIDFERSQETLDAVRKVQEALSQLEATQRQFA